MAKAKRTVATEKKWLQDQIAALEKTLKESAQKDYDAAQSALTKQLSKLGLSEKASNYTLDDIGSTYINPNNTPKFIKIYDVYFTPVQGTYGTITRPVAPSTVLQKVNEDINSLKTKRDSADYDVKNIFDTRLEAWNSTLRYLQNYDKVFSDTEWKKITTGVVPTIVSNHKYILKYNSSAPHEAYFMTTERFTSSNGRNPLMGSNVPKRVDVEPLDELWKNTSNNKGMIIPSRNLMLATTANSATPAKPILPKGFQETSTSYDVLDNNTRYAFQFQYNPTTVTMSYMGTPDIDVGMATSGSEQFALLGNIGVTQSTISLELLINRRYDMKYYDPSTRMLGKKNGGGYWTPQEIYPVWTHETEAESQQAQKDIYTKGTMYDLEYLFRGLLGYVTPSVLRGGVTADMGYVGAMPVELHLGLSLRYLGIVNSVNVHHLIFNEQMVPVYTSVTLTFYRIPDFPDSATGAAVGGLIPSGVAETKKNSDGSVTTTYNNGISINSKTGNMTTTTGKKLQ